MLSKCQRILTISILLLIVISAVTMFLFNESNNVDILRFKLQLTETARPSTVKHSEVVSSTTIIEHPKPELTIDDKILRDLNCPSSTRGDRYCDFLRDQGQSESQGCLVIFTPDSLLGGLQPAYPIAECGVVDGAYVHQSGCRIGVGTAYIIERQGKYEKIDSLSKLRAIYTPIESGTEALSYAIAATGYSALYGTETLGLFGINPFNDDVEYFVSQFENTYVEVLGSEYIVRLFDYSSCGCGRHETITVDVAVSYKGKIRELYREEVYRDITPSCID